MCGNSGEEKDQVSPAAECKMQSEHDGTTSLHPPTAFRRPELSQLYLYWNKKCGEQTVPAWGDFDLIELKFVLGNLFLLDVLREPLRFRYRVYASKMAARRGYDLTGKFLDDIPDTEWRNFLIKQYTEIVENGAPFHGVRDRYQDHRRFQDEVLALPLSSDGTSIDKLLVGVIPFGDNDTNGTRTVPQRYRL
jgi:hypothetical protein